jgi:transposase
MKRPKKRQYTDEFKAEAVRMVHGSEKPIARVAEELGIPNTTLLQWLEATRGKEDSGEMTKAEHAELQRLRRELEQVRQERDFLKKAAAFFAKNQS